jgi:hypothetical protein
MTQTRSSDSRLLRNLCVAELVGKPIVSILWLGFSDQISMVSSPDRYGHPAVSFDQVDWTLRDSVTNELLASYAQPFEMYRSVIESLRGSKYVDVEISSSFAPKFFFDNRTVLIGNECSSPDARDGDTCWELFCEDGFVLVVWVGTGEWTRMRSDVSYY